MLPIGLIFASSFDTFLHMEREEGSGGDIVRTEPLESAQQFVNEALSAVSLFPVDNYAHPTASFYLGIIKDHLNDFQLFEYNGTPYCNDPSGINPELPLEVESTVTLKPPEGDGADYINFNRQRYRRWLDSSLSIDGYQYQVQHAYLTDDEFGNIRNICVEINVNTVDPDQHSVVIHDEAFDGPYWNAVLSRLMLYPRDERAGMEFYEESYFVRKWISKFNTQFALEDPYADVDDWDVSTNDEMISGEHFPLPETY